MNIEKYWEEKHKKYGEADWIDKPSLFAKFAVKYFYPVSTAKKQRRKI